MKNKIMKNKFLIIDGNNFLYRAYYKHANLRASSGALSGVIYGFPNMLQALIKHQSPNDVIIVFDGGRDEHRKKIHPEYKRREQKIGFDREDFYRQKDDLLKILKCLGIKTLTVEKREADDIIWGLTKKLRKENQVVIVSSDKDFNQLISKNVSIWNPKANMRYSNKNIKTQTGFDYHEWVDYLILNGDESDNIKGMKGVGEKRARKFLDEFGSIERYLKSDCKELKGFEKPLLEEVFLLNRQLIDLRLFYRRYLKENIELKVKIPKLKKVDVLELSFQCAKHDIYTFKEEKFINVFNKLLKTNKNNKLCLRYL
jgi:5'-3' exonuclease